MSEEAGRTEVERRIVQRSIEDESFRQRLVEDPKGGTGARKGATGSSATPTRARA
jgi:hypothetical protein